MSKEREMICIICPNGCNLKITYNDKIVLGIEGALCSRGAEYAGNEITSPMRNLTTTIVVEGGELPLVSVRSDKLIPKDRIMEVVRSLRDITIKAPVSFKEVIVNDVLGTGADIIATREIDKR